MGGGYLAGENGVALCAEKPWSVDSKKKKG